MWDARFLCDSEFLVIIPLVYAASNTVEFLRTHYGAVKSYFAIIILCHSFVEEVRQDVRFATFVGRHIDVNYLLFYVQLRCI